MTERIHLEYDGVKTYFFAPLLEYVLENELKMVDNEEVNQFASFVMGLSNEFPTASDFYSILVGSNPENSQIVAAIDSMILFGADYFETVKQLAEILEKNGVNHDVFSLRLRFNDNTTFEKELAAHAKNSIIGKVQGSGLLKFFQDMLVAKSETERLDAFIALCAADLDWDAYVFLKLFTNGSPKLRNEIKAIRGNIIKKLEGVRGRLTHLWLTGKRSDPRSKLLRNLKKPTVDVIKLVVPAIADNIIDLISKDDDETLSKISSLTSQVLFLIFHAVLKGEWYKADKIYLNLYPCIKQKMFPAVSQAIMKASVSLLVYFLPRFVVISGSPYNVGDLKADGTLKILADPWKRDLLTKLFIDYSASISRDVFGFPVAIGYNREDLLTACQYIIDFLKNYDTEKGFFVKSDKMFELGLAHLTKQRETIAEIDAPLQENSENSVEPNDATPTNYIYTNEEMQNINAQEQQRVHIGNNVYVSSHDIDQGNDEVDLMVVTSELDLTETDTQSTKETTEFNATEDAQNQLYHFVNEDDVNSLDGKGARDDSHKSCTFNTSWDFEDAPKSAFCKSGRFGVPKHLRQQDTPQKMIENDVDSLDGKGARDDPHKLRTFETSYDFADAPKSAFCKSGRFGVPKHLRQQGTTQKMIENDVDSLDGKSARDEPPKLCTFKTGCDFADAPKSAFCKSGRFGIPKHSRQQGTQQNNNARGNNGGNSGGFQGR